jgi:colicin import membrane protein
LVVLILSFDFSSVTPVLENSDKDMKVLNAVVLDAPPGTQAPPKMIVKSQPKKPLAALPSPPPKPISKPVEQKKVVEVKPKPEAIAIDDKRKKQKELLKKQLLADLQKEVEQQKKLKHKELERAFAKELKAQTAKSLEQQLQQEQDRLASIQSQKARGEVNKYKALILQAISQHWLVPPTINKKLTCELLIRMAPGGMVLDVQVVNSSGDTGLDRSARAAVFKASPLPVPSDSDAFESFRQFILKVKPENIQSV